MFTCEKTYSDIPFAHRQHRHDGHCAFIHGWSFTFTFGCRELDECGFVVDFGKLKELKAWIDATFDHACLFNQDDPMLDELVGKKSPDGRSLFKTYVLEQCSSEGIAKELHAKADTMIRDMSDGRAFVVSTRVTEDSRNSATYTAAS